MLTPSVFFPKTVRHFLSAQNGQTPSLYRVPLEFSERPFSDTHLMNRAFKDFLSHLTQATECQEVDVIQSLWSGYGKISRIRLEKGAHETLVVKHIAPRPLESHPRGWNTDNSHQRKLRSYQIETHWYAHWNHRCSEGSRTPHFIGSFSQGTDHWIVLEDLDAKYPLRKHQLTLSEVKGCLKWLAHFHATFLNEKPEELWPIGTYWHLDTRPDELEQVENQVLKAKAHLIDKALNECRFQTIVHGDAKLANFCFSEDGKSIAAVDFQYVGGGCGMKDVAYFIGSCLSGADCEVYEKELLDFYFSQIRMALDSTEFSADFIELEEEWRRMYPMACADFNRFLLGWMPTHQKLNDYNLRLMNAVLNDF